MMLPPYEVWDGKLTTGHVKVQDATKQITITPIYKKQNAIQQA